MLYKYIYGPVSSWRLSSSLGIDPISCKEKVCTFDCIYCQLGETERFTDKREVFVPTGKIIEEIKGLPSSLKIDYITFSGRGEPTLAKNLGEMIKGIRKIRKEKIAVITNSSIIYRDDVVQDLKLADFVIAKLDASLEDIFNRINMQMQGITFERIVKGIKNFKSLYKGKLALQIMFIDENKLYGEDMARISKEIAPCEVQINTPLRQCKVMPLSNGEIDNIKDYFSGLRVVSVYEGKNKKILPISKNGTLKRRGISK